MSRANMRVLIMQNAAAVNVKEDVPNGAAPGAVPNPGPNPAASRVARMQDEASANLIAEKVAIPVEPLQIESEEISVEAESEVEVESLATDAWLETATKKDLISYLSEHSAGFDSTSRHITRARRAELVSLVEDL
jgi:hypothetical protein